MAVSIVFYGLSTLTQGILQSIGRMKAPIINASVAVVLHGAVMVLMMLFLDERYSLYYYVFATVLYAFILCVLNQISVHRHLVYRQEFFRTFFLPVIASTIMGAAAFGIYQGVYYISKSNILALGLAAALGALIYFVLMIRSQAVSEEELRGMPKGHMLLALARKLRILKPQGGKPQGEPQREPQEEPPRGGKKTNAGAGGSGKRKAAKAKGKKAGKGSKKKNGGRNASAKKQKSAKLSKETQQIKGVTVTTQTRRLYQEQMDEDDDDFWLDD